ncbi:MAG TPA: multicopper oxidase domain-containing protein [Candidatus Acidoferrales bacterium]|nr:multicopper oxidase domain-containing protein [Candidatus Acidoferrales bacterium]
MAFALSATPAAARERIYYIAADEMLWNYAPSHRDLIAGKPLPPLQISQIGWVFHKIVYRQYTDASFEALAPIPVQDRYEGIVGPTIRAEVGDTVVVVFRNHTDEPVDIAPAGLYSDPAPAAVKPEATVTYRWPIRESVGPGPSDVSSVLYTYGSDVDQTRDENVGLIGPLIVTRWGDARPDGSPKDVDREIVTLFSSQAEGRSLLIGQNLSDPKLNPRHITRKSRLFDLSNVFPSINGYVFGNMPVPVMRVGQHVRWYLLSTQNDVDGHAPTWDGGTVLSSGNRVDTVGLITPHSVADMVPDDPGQWLFICMLNVHLVAGLEATYRVTP